MLNWTRHAPQAQVMVITPDIARELLATSPHNRPIRQWYVDVLSSAMKRGEWRVTSQGVGIDNLGRLRDAHHRLRACVQSGVSFQTVVVMGLKPEAYEVTDTGMRRTVGDLLQEPKQVAEVVRLGTCLALSQSKPTVDQMRPIMDSGLGDAARSLIEFCGTNRRYYSSAGIKLAACISIMIGRDADFVLTQYRALCGLRFDDMTAASQALMRQVENGKLSAVNDRDALARGIRIFDPARKDITKIQISDSDIEAAVNLVRRILNPQKHDHFQKRFKQLAQQATARTAPGGA